MRRRQDNRVIKIDKPKFSVKIIMIDTEIMMGNVKKLPEYPERDYQGEQQDWLEEELENCYADYCLVGGHHPVYSVGSHGPTPKVLQRLQVSSGLTSKPNYTFSHS